MEPGYTSPHISPEQSPALPPVSPENLPPLQPEVQAEQTPESFEHEQAPVQQPAVTTPVSDTAVPSFPQPVVSSVSQDDAATLLTSVPDVAADDDLIEKEWVDKAKHIITETADDPYAREQAVGQLQREYLRKRYGKEVGAAEE